MKQYFDVIVVIPVGPDTKPEFLADTIDSYIHYTLSSYKILLIDDSHQGIGVTIQETHPFVDVLYTDRISGSMAGLYITLSIAYSYALKKYDFKALLKLDTDALIIGPHPEKEILEWVSENPNLGIAGQYPYDYDGKLWDVAYPRTRIVNATMTWKYIRRPIANILLRKLYLKALKHGYRTGESVFGGAYFMSKSMLTSLQENKLLPNYTLRTLNMGEDHLFGLLAKSLGYELVNLCSDDLPFACAWKGLPASPEQLYKNGKKIIHSTKYYNNMREGEIREFFLKKRMPQNQPLYVVS